MVSRKHFAVWPILKGQNYCAIIFKARGSRSIVKAWILIFGKLNLDPEPNHTNLRAGTEIDPNPDQSHNRNRNHDDLCAGSKTGSLLVLENFINIRSAFLLILINIFLLYFTLIENKTEKV